MPAIADTQRGHATKQCGNKRPERHQDGHRSRSLLVAASHRQWAGVRQLTGPIVPFPASRPRYDHRVRWADAATVALVGRVIFMCGPAGSGKSTVARRYERQGMARLSFDQEAWSRGITAMPLPPDVHRDIEHVLRARLADLVRAGSDVVLDFSFWSRHMRDEYRELLRPFGVVPETVYLATDRATVLQRIGARAACGGDDFKLSTELAAFYFDHFEVPTAAEG